MADEGKTAAAKEETPTYHVDRLTAEAEDRFDVPAHVAAGAFAGQRKQNLTLDQAQKLIDDWQKRPVEVDNDPNALREEQEA